MENSEMILARCEHSRLAGGHKVNYYVIHAKCENHCKQIFDCEMAQQSRFAIAKACDIITFTNHWGNYLW